MIKMREALSHAKAYAWEYFDRLVSENYKDPQKKPAEDNDEYTLPSLVESGINDSNTIDELCNFIKDRYNAHSKIPGIDSDKWIENGLSLRKTVRNYYNAMLLMDKGEYSGTEDRLYYRVYAGATGFSKEIHFMEPNLCLIAKNFYDVGAITKKELNSYRTRYTLKRMSSPYYKKEDGSVDIDRILDSIKPEYHNVIYDMKILNAAR